MRPVRGCASPQTAHVLNYDTFHIPGFNFRHHSHKAGAVKTGAGNSIIREMGRVWQAVVFCVLSQQVFLRGYAVAFLVGVGSEQ